MGAFSTLKNYNFSGQATMPQLGGNSLFLWNQLRAISQAINLLVSYANTVSPAPTTFANLPAANSTNLGLTAVITDSNTTTWGANAAGGSTSTVLVWCNGTHWTVIGT